MTDVLPDVYATTIDITDAEPFPMTETQQALMIGRGDAVAFGGIGCYGYFEWQRCQLDPQRLVAAWRRLVERHDMLRTVGGPDGMQRVLPQTPDYSIPVTDLRNESAAEIELRLSDVRAAMSHAVFPVGGWPLFDLRIIALPDELYRIHLGIDLQVLDASSAFQVLFPDLVDLYDDPEAELPQIPLTFADYARWRVDVRPGTEDYQRAKAYWLSRVPDLPAAPDLPTAPAEHADTPVRFDRREHRMAPGRWRRFTTIAEQAGFLPSVLLTAAFAEVIRSWASNADFTINYPVFDRPAMHDGIGMVLGDFTNAVMLAAHVGGETFLDRASALRDQLNRDLRHLDFNGIEVLRELTRLHGTGMRANMPIVVTSLLDYPGRRPVSDLGEEVYSISQTPQVSLDVQLRELAGNLRVIWDFVDGVFAPGMIDDAFASYVDLVERIVDDGDIWAERRPVRLPAWQRELRATVNDTAAPVRAALLHELLDAQVARTPDADAVVDHRRRLSYAELGAYTHRIARRLRADGVAGVGELVAIVAEKGWEQFAAVYGVLASGAAYLPLDPSVPTERLHRLLAGGKVAAVLTQARLDDELDWPDGLVRYRVDTDFETGETTPVLSVQTPTDLAYTIFTSGSTGEPKGVMVDHRGVVNLIDDVTRRFGVTGADRLLAVSGLHFDASIYDVFGIVTTGGTVVIPAPYRHAEPDVWADLVATESVTVWNSVPVLMELLVGEAEARGTGQLATVRLAVLSGDWIPLTLPDRVRAQSPAIQLVGSGGPTETICWSLFYPIGEVDRRWTSIPYGMPIMNQRYYVVDESLNERPVGVVGEMAVASEVGLAHGYWGDPELTAARFVALPATGERAYLTGDLGRYLPDGNIEIIGRDDFQVKIQGHRVELGEIETKLRRDPAVRAAVVVAPVSANGARRLHGYVVPERWLLEGGADPAALAEAVRSRLIEQVPAHLVPAVLTPLEELPLTRNGKVDRLALVELAGRSTPPAEDESAALADDALTKLVCAAIADILGIDRAGPADNFFRLGGDSLTGTRLAGLLRDLLDVPVRVKSVFDNPVPANLAAVIAADPEYGTAAMTTAEALLTLDDADDA